MMKNLLIILILVFFISSYGQEKQFVTLGFDPKLAFSGAYDYDNSSVLDITFTSITQIGNNEYGMSIEYAELKPYYFSVGLIYNRSVNLFNSYKFETLIGGEVLYLQRGKNISKSQEFFSYGANVITRYYFADFFAIGLRLNIKRRPDLIQIYNGKQYGISGYFETNYTIERW